MFIHHVYKILTVQSCFAMTAPFKKFLMHNFIPFARWRELVLWLRNMCFSDVNNYLPLFTRMRIILLDILGICRVDVSSSIVGVPHGIQQSCCTWGWIVLKSGENWSLASIIVTFIEEKKIFYSSFIYISGYFRLDYT